MRPTAWLAQAKAITNMAVPLSQTSVVRSLLLPVLNFQSHTLSSQVYHANIMNYSKLSTASVLILLRPHNGTIARFRAARLF
jgi:hypothetical protein